MMAKFELCSSCDDAGEMLAARLENSDFVRVIESHETEEAAESAKQEWMDWYAERNVPIGEGCLLIRKAQ